MFQAWITGEDSPIVFDKMTTELFMGNNVIVFFFIEHKPIRAVGKHRIFKIEVVK